VKSALAVTVVASVGLVVNIVTQPLFIS